MDDIRQGMTDVAEAATTSNQTLLQMREADASRKHQLAMLMREHTRRLTMAGWWAVGSAVVAVAIALIALFR